MATAIKTRKARIDWDGPIVKCFYYGDKDAFGQALWYDENGKCYELMYARRAKTYSFSRRPNFDKD